MVYYMALFIPHIVVQMVCHSETTIWVAKWISRKTIVRVVTTIWVAKWIAIWLKHVVHIGTHMVKIISHIGIALSRYLPAIWVTIWNAIWEDLGTSVSVSDTL